MTWQLAIVSDVHVTSSAKVPAAFSTLIARIAELAPRVLVVSGDSTVGNKNDGVGEERVAAWWQAFLESLEPVRSLGIPILPIAGNHDFYTAAHRSGYGAAWASLATDAGALGLSLSGEPPYSYSCDLDDVHLCFAHVTDQHLEPQVEAFLRADLASDAARAARLRLCFGHVPLISRMGRTSDDFKAKLGGLLAEHQVAAYISGHEHLVWDEGIPFGDWTLRQIHVGTSSGAYHFPLKQSVYERYCQAGSDSGTLPYSGRRFGLVPGTRQQSDGTCAALVEVGESSYDVLPLCLRDNALVPFGLE